MQKALALLLSAAMLLCLHPAAAQQPNTLTGTVTDSASGKAVGYATVSLQRDSVSGRERRSRQFGRPLLAQSPETGDYQLCITMVGYTPYKQAVEVPASGKALGKIAITQGVEVGDVVIRESETRS
ncbi:MAG: carboxypeptidase regulatory-like domain-containing protein [Alistipes onderdonkii]